MGGEFFGFLMEQLLEEGALDVWYTPIYMKKNRPAVKVSVLCYLKDEARLSELILRETTTLGVRSYSATRQTLERNYISVDTPYGPVTFKIASIPGLDKGSPEYEDLKKLAKAHKIPLRQVYEEAVKAYILGKDKK